MISIVDNYGEGIPIAWALGHHLKSAQFFTSTGTGR